MIDNISIGIRNVIIYSIAFCIFIQSIILLRYKFKYVFWGRIPAYHTYQWWYRFMDEQLINKKKWVGMSKDSRYYIHPTPIHSKQNLTLTTLKLEDDTIKDIVNYINIHFMNYSDARFNIDYPQLSQIISPYSKLSALKENNTMRGCIISIPFTLWLACYKKHQWSHSIESQTTKYKNPDTIQCHYVDYLCVDKKHRKQNYASNLIYSHCLNTISNNEVIVNDLQPCFIFKNEGFKTNALKPFVEYKSHVIELTSLTMNDCIENIQVVSEQGMNCLVINENKDQNYLSDCITKLYNLNKTNIFMCIGLISKEQFIMMVKNNDLVVVCLLEHHEPRGYYFFKNIHSLIESKTNEFECLASVDLSYTTNNQCSKAFIYGFKIACIQSRDFLSSVTTGISSFNLCCIESISHNYFILRETNLIRKVIHTIIPMAYYSFNGLIHQKESHQLMMIS